MGSIVLVRSKHATDSQEFQYNYANYPKEHCSNGPCLTEASIKSHIEISDAYESTNRKCVMKTFVNESKMVSTTKHFVHKKTNDRCNMVHE